MLNSALMKMNIFKKEIKSLAMKKIKVFVTVPRNCEGKRNTAE